LSITKFRGLWKWQYVLSQNCQNCIARQFYVKWSNKFDFSRIQSRLNAEFPLKLEFNPTTQAQAPELPIKLPQAPKSNSPTSSKGKKPTKKDLKAFALAFAKQFYEASEEEDEDSIAESSIHKSQIDLFQDAQDPFDAYDLSLEF